MQPIIHNPGEYEYKEYYIPKKNGTARRVFAPSAELLRIQRQAIPTLEAILRNAEVIYDIPNVLQGFVKDRNPVTAATEHIGYQHTIMMDITNFFDSVRKTHFPLRYWSQLPSKTRLLHISKDNSPTFPPQGFATSPLLANIAITTIVSEIRKYLVQRFDRFAFTVYADDIQISINSEDFIKDTSRIIDIVTFLFGQAGFQMNPHKTRIRHAKFGYRRILGVNVGDTDIRATRKTMRKLRAAKHQKNGPSAGGLTTWSRCLLPKSRRPSPITAQLRAT